MLRTKLFFIKNNFTIEVEVTPYCNFSCCYCENKKLNTFDYFKEFNINFDQLYNFLCYMLYSKSRLIYLILNGGEPTLHPKLLNFCKKISKYQNIIVLLYTNFSASIDLYKELLDYNILIYPTFHENTNIDLFIEKLYKLNIKKILLPYTKQNMLIINLFNNFNYNLVLLENSNYTLDIINNLIIYDSTIKDQFDILNKSKNIKHRLCYSNKYYLYVNSDGNIFKCMFNKNTKLGNIHDLNCIKENKPIICSNSYCFYEFS